MADLQPLHTLRYEPSAVGSLADVIAPPYDVIDAELRAQLAARSPYNVVEIDLPPSYEAAAATMADWEQRGVLVREQDPAVWVLRQDYTDPAGAGRTRTGVLARVRVDEYGPGRIRPHERTHPGPKEDRLKLTRATKANLSPIFSLFGDDEGAAARAMTQIAAAEPFASAADLDGTVNTLWRSDDENLIAELQMALADAELLIADGHHRYETARVYAEEVGGEGEHRYVLMLLCALSDPGLLVFPTHRLLTGLKDDSAKQLAIREVLMRDFEVEQLSDVAELEPPDGPVAFGYMDSFHKQPYRVTLKDQSIADRALEGMPEPYRRLDTAVLEALVLRDALGMSEDDISHLNGLDYSKNLADAIDAVQTGRADAGFFMRATPGGAGAGGRGDRRVDAAQVDLLLPQGPDRTGVQSTDVKIYTRKGDDGTTGLWYGGRVPKYAGRPEAYGSVDEAASALGLARAAAERGGELYADVLRVQNELFVLGAELATAPRGCRAPRGGGVEGHAGDGRAARVRHRPLHGPRRPAAQVRDPRRHRAVGAPGRRPRPPSVARSAASPPSRTPGSSPTQSS